MIRELTKNQRKKALKALKMLNGLPPYDGGTNVCLGDNYFGKSIPHYGMTTEELSKACGFDRIYEEWKRHRTEFLKGNHFYIKKTRVCEENKNGDRNF